MEWTAHEFHWWNAPARLEGPASLATARHSCPPRSWNRKIGFDFILACGWLWSFPDLGCSGSPWFIEAWCWGVLDKKVCTKPLFCIFVEQEQNLPAVQARELYALHHTEHLGTRASVFPVDDRWWFASDPAWRATTRAVSCWAVATASCVWMRKILGRLEKVTEGIHYIYIYIYIEYFSKKKMLTLHEYNRSIYIYI